MRRDEAERLIVDASAVLEALRTQAGIDMGKALPTVAAFEKALARFHKACHDFLQAEDE